MATLALAYPYSQWPAQFLAIKSELETYLADIPYISIEHVGSTSVPNLIAKPILDIDVIVPRSQVEPAIAALTTPTAGYHYVGTLEIEDRHSLRLLASHAYTASGTKLPSRNLYVIVEGCLQLRNHLGVRDVLRKDEALREEYGRVKVDLLNSGVDLDEYVAGKSGVLQRILEKAGLTTEEREVIGKVNRNWKKGRDRNNFEMHV
jgi:GrpB-like predicted nucleotidyltransferase (UPF0157 family)